MICDADFQDHWPGDMSEVKGAGMLGQPLFVAPKAEFVLVCWARVITAHAVLGQPVGL